MRAVLRRARRPDEKPARIRTRQIEIDVETHTAAVRGRPVGLTRAEFDLLAALASREETEFVGGVHRWLVPGVLLCAALALLAMAALSRRIFGPVEALTHAARRMEGGDLSQRVATRSRDEIGSSRAKRPRRGRTRNGSRRSCASFSTTRSPILPPAARSAFGRGPRKEESASR